MDRATKIVHDDPTFSKVSCHLLSHIARPHSAVITVEIISQFGLEQLPHSLYSPDQTPSKERK